MWQPAGARGLARGKMMSCGPAKTAPSNQVAVSEPTRTDMSPDLFGELGQGGRVPEVLGNSVTRDCEAVAVEKASVQQLLHHYLQCVCEGGGVV